MITLSGCTVKISVQETSLVRKVLQILQEETFRRTSLHLNEAQNQNQGSYIELRINCASADREGFLLEKIENGICITGGDERGLLYGVGFLLRKSELKTNSFVYIGPSEYRSSPRYAIRGQQLGYRPLNNTFEAWTPEQFDLYIREMALFGANSIEILPSGTDDDDIKAALQQEVHGTIPENWKDHTGWPLMRHSFDEMLVALSDIIHSYGMDTWLWLPNMCHDYTKNKLVEKDLAERDKLFRMIPYLDNVFIPGGDPGELTPEQLFDWGDRLSKVLHSYHKNAGIWLSLQSFRQSDEWLSTFLKLALAKPAWLTGLVFSPWQRMTLAELHSKVGGQFPIRHYPDIGHSVNCQYPVPNWDTAFAMIHGREGFNPRPISHKQIHNLHAPFTVGSIGYSEGINDDVNKFIWLMQDWNPDSTAEETLCDYSRLFIDSAKASVLADAFVQLEKNWIGPAISNTNIDNTFSLWEQMNSVLPEKAAGAYRFQMGYLRAIADYWIRKRLIHESDIEKAVMVKLREAKDVSAAVKECKAILAVPHPDAKLSTLRKRMDELADSLFRSIKAQTSVVKYEALAWNRGAFMDTIDLPLNNRLWLENEFDKILRLTDPSEQIAKLKLVVSRKEVGDGEIYENFGVCGQTGRSHTLNGADFDPGQLKTPFITHALALLHQTPEQRSVLGPVPLEWISNIHALYDTPLVLEYDVDPKQKYTLALTYLSNMFGPAPISLTVNDTEVLHDNLIVTVKVMPYSVDIPESASRTGRLSFKWTTPSGYQGVNIAELWIKLR